MKDATESKESWTQKQEICM